MRACVCAWVRVHMLGGFVLVKYLAVKWCNIKCVFLCCLSSVAVQPSAANTPDAISGE